MSIRGKESASARSPKPNPNSVPPKPPAPPPQPPRTAGEVVQEAYIGTMGGAVQTPIEVRAVAEVTGTVGGVVQVSIGAVQDADEVNDDRL